MSQKKQGVEFNHILVLKNPASTLIRQTERHINEIARLHPGASCTVVETAADSAETWSRLRAHANVLGPNTLLCVAGGDGTVNQVVSFLLGERSLPASARRTLLLPLWAGNANDLAHMANGSVLRLRLPSLFADASAVPIYPLVCTLTSKRYQEQVYYATNYVSFGVTAALARELNDDAHRQRRWRRIAGSRFIGEVVALGRTFLHSDGFTLQEEGAEYPVHERSYLNGPRMAKLQPLAADLTRNEFVQVTVPQNDKHIVAVWRWLSGSVRTAPKPVVVSESSFISRDDIWMQTDGEPMPVHKDTRVSIQCTREPLYLLSTRLAGKTVPKAANRSKKRRQPIYTVNTFGYNRRVTCVSNVSHTVNY